MERVISPEERIRRAEEIYNRRKMQTGVRVPTSRVNTSVKDKYKLYKKLILQIAICFVIYFIFYLIENSNYIFSEQFIKKTREFLSYDINFGNIYNSAIEYYNNNIRTQIVPALEENINTIQDTNEEQSVNEISEESTNQNAEIPGGIGGGEDVAMALNEQIKQASSQAVVQLSQMEIDANEIKEKHSLILPLKGVVTSRYGPREGNEIVSANHVGIDIGANEGTVFVAAMSGTVIKASGEGTYGNHIFIENEDVITVYAHCKKLYVKEGDIISQGQKIGEVGETGNATGPHLHFEIRKAGRTINPEYVLTFG